MTSSVEDDQTCTVNMISGKDRFFFFISNNLLKSKTETSLENAVSRQYQFSDMSKD